MKEGTGRDGERGRKDDASFMDNRDISRLFDEIAFWLEIAGDNPFKIRSYANAARVISKMGDSVEGLFREGTLRDVEGIGSALEKKIGEALDTGKIAYLEGLRDRFPPGLFELSKLQGVGAKTIKHLYETLHLDSPETLRDACERGEIAALKGYGKKKQEKILEALRFLEAQEDRHHLHTAWNEANALYRYLGAHPSLRNIAVTGSLRRYKETVGDIDLLAASDEPDALMNHFLDYSEVDHVVSPGARKSTVVTRAGIPVDFHLVSERQWPCTLLHLSGSKGHIARLRARASGLGLELTEQGLFRSDGSEIPCAGEADIYNALNLPFFPPEMREDLYNLDSPPPERLVEAGDLVGTLHCHSTWSDGINPVQEIAEAAREMGYLYVVITDHSQSSVIVEGLTPERVFAQHAEIDALNKRIQDIRIVKGIESDILGDGSLDYAPEVLDACEFVIASIHSNFEMTEEESTRRLVRAMEDPHTSVIGHLTGRLLLSRSGYPVDVDKVVDAAIDNGVAFEINANPRRLDMDWRHLRKAADKGAMFALGSDAHRVAGLSNMHFGVAIARKGGLGPDCILNCKPVEEIIRWRGEKR